MSRVIYTPMSMYGETKPDEIREDVRHSLEQDKVNQTSYTEGYLKHLQDDKNDLERKLIEVNEIIKIYKEEIAFSKS